MLITFKSKAYADITMYKEHAQRIVELLNKSVDKGIILHTDTQEAIRILEAAIKESRLHPISEYVEADVAAHPQQNGEEDHAHGPFENVGFASRAYPFLEMLRAANEARCDVVWGV